MKKKRTVACLRNLLRRKVNLIYCICSLKSLLFPVLFLMLKVATLYGRTEGVCLGRNQTFGDLWGVIMKHLLVYT